jgi:alanyl-tRNA synthetase
LARYLQFILIYAIGFEKSLTSARIPCKSIPRYPTVARWRNDVDFTAAGIYCFQPYCVTGELDPPANPLIQPQFCARFNDLDNIGLTGRHYSGFIMLGIQVFNYPNDYKFFKDECVEFNYRWLTEELGIPKEEITFVEDVWAGGGNLGPSIEYFVRGLEVGNMVFMQYKTFPDGSREELKIKVIDVGIGLERIPWLMNGTATSYMVVFKNAFEWLSAKLGLSPDQSIWEKFGPFSSQLDVDEAEDIDKTWNQIAEIIGKDLTEVRDQISPIKDLYIILDHTRTVMITIIDGSLPSNVGGGGNVRNILRRVFAIMNKNGWWDKIGGMEGFLTLFDYHKKDLEGIFGEFKEYKSFNDIIEVEYDRWSNTDEAMKNNLLKLLKKKKGQLTLEDWDLCMSSYGIPADTIAQVSGLEIPTNLYYYIADKKDRITKATPAVLYDTSHLPETENLYYKNHHLYDFESQITDVFLNVEQENKQNIIILSKSAFYPTSGGQIHDTGKIWIGEKEYDVINVEKVGKSVLHIVEPSLEGDKESYIGKDVKCQVDQNRRNQLRSNHTGTHIVFAACRQVLGPHVWQNGAKKTLEMAHLDITHFKSLTKEEELEIENAANRIICQSTKINKYMMDKTDAEKEYGFSLYQGGIVPGNELRIVNIEGVDTEACCGTHCDNTSEVGWIKMINSRRISDGIVRLYYVANERAMEIMNKETILLQDLCRLWGIDQPQIFPTAKRFFDDYKKFKTTTQKQDGQILGLQMKCLLSGKNDKLVVESEHSNPKIYFSNIGQYAAGLKESGKSVVFIGSSFIFALCGDKTAFKLEELQNLLKETNPDGFDVKKVDKINFKVKGQKKPTQTKDILQVSIPGVKFDKETVHKFFSENGFDIFDN